MYDIKNSEFPLILHCCIRKTFQSTIMPSTNEYPVNPPNFFEKELWRINKYSLYIRSTSILQDHSFLQIAYIMYDKHYRCQNVGWHTSVIQKPYKVLVAHMSSSAVITLQTSHYQCLDVTLNADYFKLKKKKLVDCL